MLYEYLMQVPDQERVGMLGLVKHDQVGQRLARASIAPFLACCVRDCDSPAEIGPT